ncbi:malonate decarboxylase holo-[acyl-carrier-protein] synthase [Duganella callida]|uniref:Malonate decarboxylase holo-[acyl-carrier-protein] synthase n=1 Tax=Duganella callida TaxID=2561932 RepID=A0A4Y9SBD4_9BURK|nr:malonate decarboxylase holo-[acyl-carrier-protein] synthase [Duganella callida]TFW16923.1 malonate decarboxylase holo-[acyl-carrier-protein] synthase [Duganella callida]
MTHALERHQLVWLTAAGWRATLAAARPQQREAIKLWRGQDWPAVVRRAEPDAAADEVCLGLPLPPERDNGGKLRIALRAQVAHIARSAPPIALAAALRSSGCWRERLAALVADAAGLELRVYGSLAMQSLTGLLYLSPRSDVDLLFRPASRQQLDDGMALLSRHAQLLPLDGEIIFPGGQAVAWQEWRMAMAQPARVLVKSRQTVRLADTASLLVTLPMRLPQPALDEA